MSEVLNYFGRDWYELEKFFSAKKKKCVTHTGPSHPKRGDCFYAKVG